MSKRAADRQLTRDDVEDEDEQQPLTGPLPVADAAVLKTRRFVRARRAPTGTKTTGGLFANLSTAPPPPLGGAADEQAMAEFGKLAKAAGAKTTDKQPSSPFGSLGASSSPFSVTPGSFPPSPGASAPATTFPAPDTSAATFALPKPFAFGGSGAFSFGYGESAAASSGATASSSGFTFGAFNTGSSPAASSPASGFGAFASGQNALSVAAKENEGKAFEKGGDEDPEAFQPEIQPITQSEGSIALQRGKPAGTIGDGEEEDVNLFQANMTLFEAKGSGEQNWGTRWDGCVRINRTKLGTVRLIFRDSLLKVVLHQMLQDGSVSLPPEPKTGDKMLGPFLLLSKEGKPRTFCLRVRKGHDCDVLKLWQNIKAGMAK